MNYKLSLPRALSLLATAASVLIFQSFTAQGAKVIGSYGRIYEGIEYATGSDTYPRLNKVFALRISLRNPAVSLKVTSSNGTDPYEVLRAGTDSFLTAKNCEVAVNASFFDAGLSPNTDILGTYITGGVAISSPEAAPFNSQLRFTDEKIVTLLTSSSTPTGFEIVIPGSEIILRHGDVLSGYGSLNPHTAYGISEDGKYLIIVCVDGRQPGWSEGCTYPELGQWLLDFGAWDGVNMDGGGSTCMVRKDTGVVNRPSDGSVRAVAVNFGANSSASTSQGPAAVAWNTNRIDVFSRGALNIPHQKTWTSSVGWTNFEEISTTTLCPPAVCSWQDGRLDLFYAYANDDLIKWKTYSGGAWGATTSLGVTTAKAPAVCSWGTNRMDLFYVGLSNNQIYWKSYSGGAWGAATSLGSTTTSMPVAACSSANGRIDLFFVNASDSEIYWKVYSGGAWSASTSLGSTTTAKPLGVSSSGNGQIDLFFVDSSTHTIKWKKYSGSSWTSSTSLGGPKSASNPAPCARGAGIVDLFSRGTDDHLNSNTYTNGAWSGWVDLGPYFD